MRLHVELFYDDDEVNQWAHNPCLSNRWNWLQQPVRKPNASPLKPSSSLWNQCDE
jgi:hypothetical protein